MKVGRAVFLCCIIVGFAALFFVLSPAQRNVESPELRADLESEEDILVEGLTFSEWEEGRLTWSMVAQSGRYFHKEEVASFEDVAGKFLPPAGGKMTLSAEHVDYDLRDRVLVARDSVKGRSDQGYDFTTRSLHYDGASREVSTDDKVTFEKDRLTVQGTGMKGSLTDHTFRLLSNVRAVFVPQETAP